MTPTTTVICDCFSVNRGPSLCGTDTERDGGTRPRCQSAMRRRTSWDLQGKSSFYER